MSFSFLGIFCGVFVFISAIIYFIADYKNKDDDESISYYFIPRIILAIVFSIIVAFAISM